MPSNAVVDYAGRRGVFVAASDDTVTFRPVRVGIEESTQIEILDGVAEGDRVVTIGAAGLRDGASVIISTGGGRDGASADGPSARDAGAALDRQFDDPSDGESRPPRGLNGEGSRQGGDGAPSGGRRGQRPGNATP